jgi:hypothetical protein
MPIGISAIEQAEDFAPILELNEQEEANLKVKLINYGHYKLNKIAERSFENIGKQLGIEYQTLHLCQGFNLVSCNQSTKPQSLTNFNKSKSILSISKVPVFKLTKSDLFEEGDIKVKIPIKRN